jgi:zinc transporter
VNSADAAGQIPFRRDRAGGSDRLAQAVYTQIPGCTWALWFDENGDAYPGTGEDSSSPVFRWLHFDRSDVRVPAALRGLSALDDEDALDSLTGHVDHQYVELVGGTTYGAIIDHETTFEGRDYETDFLRFAFNDKVIITSRRKPLQSAEAVRTKIGHGESAQSPLAVFDMLATSVCDCITRMSHEIALDLDRIEDRVLFEDIGRAQRAPLGKARREAVRLARQIGGIQATFETLQEAALANETEELAEVAATLQQLGDSLLRDVSNLQDRARALQEEVNAILTLETNDRLFILTIITTLILPATFVTGFFGMNTKNLFFAESDSGTLWAAFLCICASALALVVLRSLGFTRPSQTAQSRSIGRPRP